MSRFARFFILCVMMMVMIKTVELQTTESLALSNVTTLPSVNPGSNTTKGTTPRRQFSCEYAPGLAVGDRDWELRCCSVIQQRYEIAWAILNKPLSRYLETLKSWNCPQFEGECKRQLFATTPFTRLLYDYFCDFDNFVSQCIVQVNETVTTVHKRYNKPLLKAEHFEALSQDNSTDISHHWKEVVAQINISQLSLEELLQPCMQVAQFDLEKVHNGDFQEITSIEVPSCEQVWCGISGSTLTERVISVWTCMSSSCHAKVITIMTVCGIMALAITIVNFSVIVAIVINPPLQHSQSTYKISLAVADLMVGIIVLPTCISNLARLVWTQHVEEDFYDVQGYQVINGTLSENISTVSVRIISGQFGTKYPRSYRNAVGFFTAISIFVSVYTLAGAGFDRLIAVFRPLSYRKDTANKAAKWVCVLSWGFAIFFATLPFYVPTLPYGLILSILVANVGQRGVYLYAVGFVVPLIIVWVVNILTFRATQKHSKFRRQLTQASQIRTQRIENRLARTLGLMVGVFTVNTMPLIILLVCALFIPNNLPSRPRLLSLRLHFAYIILEYVAVMLLFSNSFWNFFIYSFRNMDFRVAVKGMYRNASKSMGVSSFVGSAVSRFRRMAYDGRRRISTLPTLSTYATTRKKSSVPTVITKDTTSSSSAHNENVEITQDNVFSPQISNRESSTSGPISANRNMDSTFIETDSSVSNKSYKKRTSISKSKKKDESLANDDSIFRSFAIDANADRLFVSVMENIDENINDEDETSIEAKNQDK